MTTVNCQGADGQDFLLCNSDFSQVSGLFLVKLDTISVGLI